MMIGRQLLTALVSMAFLTASAPADAPMLFCVGNGCGGAGPRNYTYYVDAASYPMMEFTVGTMDPDPSHYRNVLIPPSWGFEIDSENMGLGHACGFFAEHGEISFGPCYSLTTARARWWTENPDYAVELFVFGYDHRWTPEDVSWHLLTRREGEPPEWFEFTEWWNEPVGTGLGPLHGPWTTPDQFNLGAEEIVCDDAGTPIEVPGYSVPRFVHWNADVLPDLVIGEGGHRFYAKKAWPKMLAEFKRK